MPEDQTDATQARALFMRGRLSFCWAHVISCTFCLAAAPAATGPVSGPLRVHPQNPRYFTDGTRHADRSLKAVYLTGSHTWANLIDRGPSDPPPVFDFDGYLDLLQKHHHNFIRLWGRQVSWYHDYGEGQLHAGPLAWSRTGPGKALDGKPKFDLTKLNQAYFDRLRARVSAARERGIYVGIMLFGGSYECRGGWRGNPFNVQNNINGVNGDPSGDGQGPESHTLAVPAVTRLQEAYVRKVIDTVNDLDNVLYEISNEGEDSSRQWQYHLIRLIHDYEAAKPKQHPVGMTAIGSGDAGSNEVLSASPAEWISPHTFAWGGVDDIPIADGAKVSLLDSDHWFVVELYRNPVLGRQWVWKSFCRGHNPILMEHLPPQSMVLGTCPLTPADPGYIASREAMGRTRRLAERMNLAALTPFDDLAGSGYCLADPGKEYLVYLPEGGAVTVDLCAVSGPVTVEWLDPRSGGVAEGQNTSGGRKRSFTPPFDADAVLYLRQPGAGISLAVPAEGAMPSDAAPADAFASPSSETVSVEEGREDAAGRTARKAPGPGEAWWLTPNLRVVTYEFLEREHLGRDLSVEEILSWLDRMGGCDLLLVKGFHYWRGRFDDSSWGYPRFRDQIAALTARLHRAGIRIGVFGFTDRKNSYAGQPDRERIMSVWKGYADTGADILFVDEESAEGGLSIPAACLEHCDWLRAEFKLPVGIFLYGPATGAGRVREIAAHVDVVGEMGYELFLEARGDYGLVEVTKAWSSAITGARREGTAYWTGVMVPEEAKAPGTPFWRERFGARGLSEYFCDYPRAALQNGATGIFFHSICRLAKLSPRERAEVIAGRARRQNAAQGPLHVHPDNPRYFTDGSGQAVYLTGFQYWDVVREDSTPGPDAMEFTRFLDIAERYGTNFVRLWRWNELAKFRYSRDGAAFQSSPSPWARTGPGTALDGKPKFDLTKFDPAYFDRLRSRVAAAGERGFHVAVMLFEGHSLQFSDPPWRWDGHPFHKDNNINGLDGDPDGSGRAIRLHTLELPAVTAVQEAYVRKVIDTVNDLDNVLYEITNESHPGSADWQYHMVRFIKAYQSGKPRQHPVWMSSHQGGPSNTVLLASPADCIAPTPEGGYRDNPPAADGRKVILSDTDHLWGAPGDRVWVWKTFLRGLNPINYMELTQLVDPSPRLEQARRALGDTRRWAGRMDLAAMTPRNDLASTAYCLAHPGHEYLIYQPKPGEALTVDLNAGKYHYEWFRPAQGKTTGTGHIEASGGSRQFKPPFDGDAVLYLKAVH